MQFKSLFAFLILSFHLISNQSSAQPQRLAVIGALQGAAQTICIDYFAEIPAKTDLMKRILPIAGEATQESNLVFIGTGKTNTAKILGEVQSGTINGPFIVGTEKASASIGEHYRSFLEKRIDYYKKQGTAAFNHDALQQEVWEYDVLDHLGYMKKGGEPETDYVKALNAFEDDFGSQSADELLIIGSKIKELTKANAATTSEYKFLFVAKNQSTGDFIVFDGLKKPIYQGNDKRKLVSLLDGTKNGDNLHIELHGFASTNSQEAFLTDLRTNFRMQRNITISTSKFDPILFSGELKHKLNTNLISDPVKMVKIGNTDYYRGSVGLQSGNSSSSSSIFFSEAVAISHNENVVSKFVAEAKIRLSGSYKKFVLANSLSSIKSYVVRSTGISSDQLIVFLNSEISMSLITKSKTVESSSIVVR